MKLSLTRLLNLFLATRIVTVEQPPAAAEPVDEAAEIQKIWKDTRPPAPTVEQLEQIRDALAADTDPAASPDRQHLERTWLNRPVPGKVAVYDRPVGGEPIAVVDQGEPFLGPEGSNVAHLEPVPDSSLEREMVRRGDVRVPASLGERLRADARLLPWPPVPMRYDGSPLSPVPQSDYVPTTPPPAPLPRGTATGPGFARVIERIDDVIAQEAAAKRYFDGLGDE